MSFEERPRCLLYGWARSLLLVVIAVALPGCLGEPQRIGHRHARPADRRGQRVMRRSRQRRWASRPAGRVASTGTPCDAAAKIDAAAKMVIPSSLTHRGLLQQPPAPSAHRDSTSSCTNVSSLRMVMLGMTTTCAMSPSHASCAEGARGWGGDGWVRGKKAESRQQARCTTCQHMVASPAPSGKASAPATCAQRPPRAAAQTRR